MSEKFSLRGIYFVLYQVAGVEMKARCFSVESTAPTLVNMLRRVGGAARTELQTLRFVTVLTAT